jgi:hypothetical protein
MRLEAVMCYHWNLFDEVYLAGRKRLLRYRPGLPQISLLDPCGFSLNCLLEVEIDHYYATLAFSQEEEKCGMGAWSLMLPS